MKILFLTRYDRLGASSRYRTLQYIPYLQSRGIECVVSPLFTGRYLENKYTRGKARLTDVLGCLLGRLARTVVASGHDLVVIEKEMFPYAPLLLERILRPGHAPYVLDYDDAVFHKYDESPSWLIRSALRGKIPAMMRMARRVITGNRYLTEFVLKAGGRPVEIPTVVDLRKYPSTKGPEPGVFTIGWIGSPTSSAYVLDVLDVLKSFCSRNPCRVRLVGFDRNASGRLGDVPVEIVPWTEAGEVGEIRKFTVGIMPLPDTPWARGKCGLKLLQYMGCFLPVIASPVGANSDIVVDGVNGFQAKSAAEWLTRLGELCTDAASRRSMGIKGRGLVEDRYSFEATRDSYLDTLLDAVNR